MKIGIALSGGGTRGIAHAGVLKALEENNIKINAIGGTSSGALIAGLYVLGYAPEEMLDLFKKHAKEIVGVGINPMISRIRNIIKKQNTGFRKGEDIEKLFNQLAQDKGIKTISEINNMPIAIPAINIKNGKEHLFGFGNCVILSIKEDKNIRG